MNQNCIIPVILCGGSGTRLWPLSRESYPKQFLPLISENKKSLLQETQERISGINNLLGPILICNEGHRFIVAEQMREIDIKPYSILLEPFGRNTAPAIALAAMKALENQLNPTLLVLSSDHEIKNTERFIKTIKEGFNFAEAGRLVTFGIIPTSPNTGYGYIRSSNSLDAEKVKGYDIEEFTEKPDLETAKKFLKTNRYTWNSGMFMFKAKTIIDEISKYQPDIIKTCKETLFKSNHDLDFQRLNQDAFKKCPNLSIDIAVMEKTDKGTVLPLNAGWNDIGSWEAIWETSNKDKNGNFRKGKTIVEETKNCYIRSENRLLVALGLEDLIIVETGDAILISNKKQTQKVKDIVKKLKDENIIEGQIHKKVYRPWGYYLSVAEDSKWQVKLINVKAGEQLSLQMHKHRSEHWVVVKGIAKVEVDHKISNLGENQSAYIPLGSKHRLTNPGQTPLIIVEIQSGSYLGEDDIVRFKDKYGR